MIGVTLERIDREIAAAKTLSRFDEHIRAHLLDEEDLTAAATQQRAIEYVAARKNVCDRLHWRVFSHCALVTRLYAAYESFVYELVSAWLAEVPALYPTYAELPEVIAKHHRAGVGVLLQKFGAGARTESLTELSIVQPLYSGLSGQGSFTLTPEAFFIEARNLRHEELCTLFNKVSLGDLGSFLQESPELRAACDAAGSTVAGRLKELVEFRNAASHARYEVDDILGVTAFQEAADFIGMLCRALHQFVKAGYVDALLEQGRLERIGRTTEHFQKANAVILTTESSVRLNVGDSLIARGKYQCESVTVREIRHLDQSIETITSSPDLELGVQFDPPIVGRGAHLFRIQPEYRTVEN